MSEALRRIRSELGEPDILVNAAGIGVWKPFGEISDAEHHAMMDVNYWGAYNWIREVLTWAFWAHLSFLAAAAAVPLMIFKP